MKRYCVKKEPLFAAQVLSVVRGPKSVGTSKVHCEGGLEFEEPSWKTPPSDVAREYAAMVECATGKLVDFVLLSKLSMHYTEIVAPPPEPTVYERFVTAFNELAADAHATARSKGFWDQPAEAASLHAFVDAHENGSMASDALHRAIDKLAKRNDGEAVALMTSELSELLEGLRAGDPPDDKVPQHSSSSAEGADAIIRIMDWAKGTGRKVAEALVDKMVMNKTRERMNGGKQF